MRLCRHRLGGYENSFGDILCWMAHRKRSIPAAATTIQQLNFIPTTHGVVGACVFWEPKIGRRTGFWRQPCLRSKGHRRSTLCYGPYTHPCCTALKTNDIPSILCKIQRLGAPLTLFFSCTTMCHSAITPATPRIGKCTTRRWTLWWSHYGSVA